MSKKKPVRSGWVVPILLTLLLMAGVQWDRRSMIPPADSEPYHEKVRRIAATAPQRIGTWIGQDVKVPTEAVDLLHPNVLISRQYRDVATGESVSLLLVQCNDVRDLASHYPPICYPYRGWRLAEAVPQDWKMGDVTINGTEYRFENSSFQRADTIIVENFMIIPNGQTGRDRAELLAQLPLQNRYYGAGQVQLVVSATMPPERRNEVFTELLNGYAPIINAILDGIPKAQ